MPKGRCPHCSRRVNPLMLNLCDACENKFCVACLQPEVHECTKLSEKVNVSSTILAANMQRIETDKGLASKS